MKILSLVVKHKKATAKSCYDYSANDWVGMEELRELISVFLLRVLGDRMLYA